MLLGPLGASLLGNRLTGQGVNRAGKGRGINRAGEGVLRADYGKKRQKKQQNGFLIPPHPLTNSEIQKYYQNQPRFIGVYSRDKLPKTKDGGLCSKS